MSGIRMVFNLEPVAKGRPRMSKFGAYTPAKTRKAEKELAESAKYQMKVLKQDPYACPLIVAIEFILKKPKKPSQPFPSRSDIDNYAKLVCDALNEIVWDDDSLIVDLYLIKRWGETGRITLNVTPIPTGQL
jgi:Holliday junction resolvase RusA-like endonuclease